MTRSRHPSRPARVALRALVLSAVAGLALGLAACGGSSSTATLPPLHPGLTGPASMFTPANDLAPDPNATLDELRRLGVDDIHIYMHWADLAPDPSAVHTPAFDATDPAAYPASAWAPYDVLVRDVAAHGMKLVLDLVPPPPRWAEGKGAVNPTAQPQWRPSDAEFAQFVRAVGTRYSGHYTAAGGTGPLPRVDFWSIWNEPNLGVELAPQALANSYVEVSPMLYRAIVNAAWSALHATGHGGDTILIGEVAPAGGTFGYDPGLFGNMAPLRFLRALYCVGSSYRPLTGTTAAQRGCPTTAASSAQFRADNPGLFDASGFADHPYPQGLPPATPTPHEPDYAELADTGKLEHTLDTLQAVYGSHNQMPIYSTEFGYQTHPPDTEDLTVDPATAATYLNWSEYLTWLDPRLRSYDQYLLQDPSAGFFATGLETAAGAAKPGLQAFRMPIWLPVSATRKGGPLVVWGCVRPAPDALHETHHPQTVRIQFAPGGSSRFRTVKTVPITNVHGYFEVRATFPSSGEVRLAWTYPHGPQIMSRTAVITLR